MPKYVFEGRVTGTCKFLVEADNLESARLAVATERYEVFDKHYALLPTADAPLEVTRTPLSLVKGGRGEAEVHALNADQQLIDQFQLFLDKVKRGEIVSCAVITLARTDDDDSSFYHSCRASDVFELLGLIEALKFRLLSENEESYLAEE